jgi:hypothetical protein
MEGNLRARFRRSRDREGWQEIEPVSSLSI